jgi:peptidoglycan hydrolase-like protein with peptidoglycan-binding domain
MPDKLSPLNSSGAGVAPLHSQLQNLGFELPAFEVTNKKFGTATRNAVKTFQKQNELPPTGKVSAKTASKPMLRQNEDCTFTNN